MAFPIIRPYVKNRFLAAPFGEYRYSVLDLAGNKVAEGEITVDVFAHNAMQGRWRLHYFNNKHPNFDYLSGEIHGGPLAGEVRGNEIEINLNLNMADANDDLKGTLETNAMRGEFLFCGFAGCTAIGKFEAVRK